MTKSTDVSTATIAEHGPRVAKPIDPKSVRRQSDVTHVYKEVFVVLPQGGILQDLNDPSIWRKVQADSRTALSRLDRVVVTDYDQTWVVDAVVTDASLLGVTLGGIRKVDLPQRVEQLLETERFKTVFRGGAYVTVRKSDGVAVTPPETSKMMAERRHADLLPRPAA
jgi:hypothetical protein